jgi:hypothetical protein
MMAAVHDDDMREVVAKLVDLAKGGDVAAIKLLMDRCLGKEPSPSVAVQVNQVSEPGAGRGLALRIVERIRVARVAEK